MTTHIIQAKKIQNHEWNLWNVDMDESIGEERPYHFETRKEAYGFCEKSWPLNSVWEGRRVHGGYRIVTE